MKCKLPAIVTAACLALAIDSAAEPLADRPSSKPMHIVLLADGKDHGPAGNGLHDYPLWQKRWAALLSGQGKGDSVGTPARHAEAVVSTARNWPSDEQFKTADVIVAYCYLNWTEKRLAQVDRYLEDGGGLVLIHSATWTKPEPSQSVAEVTGVGGFALYRHGEVQMHVAAPQHPICAGLPKTIVLKDDETYWPPTPLADNVTILATSIEEKGARGNTPKAAQPMLWCYEPGRGRVFGCVPGHCVETFDDPTFRTVLLRAIAWAAGEKPTQGGARATASRG